MVLAMRRMKAALVVPTLNEIDGVRAIMPRIKKDWVDDIVFVDGNSTDGTTEYIKKHGYNLVLEKRLGGRYAMAEAVNNLDSDIVVQFSPDGNCIPEVIPELIRKMGEGFDMVIASRFADGARSHDESLITAFGNWMFTTLVNVLHGGKYTDVMNIYRAYKKELVKDLALDEESTFSTAEWLFRTKLAWEPILSVRASRAKLKITEIPADEPPRIGGKSKLKAFRWGGGYLFQIIKEAFCGLDYNR
jgi:glycosyltransferase involved in cell wall biosynthesis